MAQAPPDLLGRLAVHYGMIDMSQLSAATEAQDRSPNTRLGEILVELGFIKPPQLAQLLEAQRQYLAQQASSAGQVLAEAQQQGPGGARSRTPAGARPPGPPPPPSAPSAPLSGPLPGGPQVQRPRIKAPPAGQLAFNPQRVQWLHRVLDHACSIDASDLHLHAGAPVKVRVYHKLKDLMPEVLGVKEVESVLGSVMTQEQRETFFLHGEVDFTYAVPQVGRFRTSIYGQHTGPAACFHYIPEEPPTLADLGMPNTIAKLVNHQNGIVLITGPAGSGKTSTMAALINLLNEERSDHVLSIEDPIEYIHRSKRAVVNQREVNRHTHSFARALRSALREDPDVICIGELRDLETIALALSAAETGHLVLGTIHTQGVIRTINRIVGAYPPAQQTQIRTMLSESLRAIISQKLIPRADGGGMVVAYELLMANIASANLIRENRTFQLGQVLQMGRGRGMRSMDESLMELVKDGVITKRAAAREAEDPRPFID